MHRYSNNPDSQLYVAKLSILNYMVEMSKSNEPDVLRVLAINLDINKL
jgi:hypothetical protein